MIWHKKTTSSVGQLATQTKINHLCDFSWWFVFFWGWFFNESGSWTSFILRTHTQAHWVDDIHPAHFWLVGNIPSFMTILSANQRILSLVSLPNVSSPINCWFFFSWEVILTMAYEWELHPTEKTGPHIATRSHQLEACNLKLSQSILSTKKRNTYFYWVDLSCVEVHHQHQHQHQQQQQEEHRHHQFHIIKHLSTVAIHHSYHPLWNLTPGATTGVCLVYPWWPPRPLSSSTRHTSPPEPPMATKNPTRNSTAQCFEIPDPGTSGGVGNSIGMFWFVKRDSHHGL